MALRQSIVDSLSKPFERLGCWSYDHRMVVLAGCALVLAGFAFLASSTRFDNSFDNYFARDDPAYSAYRTYLEDFGSDEVSYILYSAPDHEHGPWNFEVMRKVQHLTAVLEEEVPFAKRVVSLANIEFMEPVEGGIRTYDLLDDFTGDQSELLEIRDKLVAKPIYVDSFVDASAEHAVILIEMDRSSVDSLDEIRLDPDGGDGLGNLYPQVSHDQIEEILARPEYGGIVFHHTGDVPLNASYNQIAAEEGGVLGALTFLVVGLTLALFFRRPIGVVGPPVVVALSLVVAVGLVGAFGWKLDMFFAIMPTLLISIGVANSVHIVSEFEKLHRELGDRREAIRLTLERVGPPCLLASVTTATGFGALVVAPIETLAHFAVYSALGVLATFLLSVTLLVVFLSLGRRRRDERSPAASTRAVMTERAVVRVAVFTIRWRVPIIVVFVLLFAASIAGMPRIRVDSNFINDLTEKVPVRRATSYADAVMGGTQSYIYIFDTGEPDGIKDPEFLREIERLQQQADLHSDVVQKTHSIVDLLKDINQTFHEGDPAHYRIPESRDLVAQYLLVYEMSGGDELDNFVTGDYSRATLDLRCDWVNSSRILTMTSDLDGYLARQPIDGIEIQRTGIGALWTQLMSYITESQIRGFVISFSVITVFMCLLFRSVRTGLLAMVPNVSPVLLTLGVMGWFDIALNYTTLLIAPVAIGIAVDDTIHLMTRYRQEFARIGRYEEALISSMRGVGRALFITSSVLVLGFLVNLMSVTLPQQQLGILLAGTIVMALLADFLLMPALILSFRPFGPERSKGSIRNQDTAETDLAA